jgi:hypothetical protein
MLLNGHVIAYPGGRDLRGKGNIMNRITSVTEDAKEMDMLQLAYNKVFMKDGWAWYRDYDREIPVIDLIKEIIHHHNFDAELICADSDEFGDIMMDNLQYGTDGIDGVIAILYQTLWAMTDMRERLKTYEDTSLEPEEVEDLKNSEDYWHREAIKWAARLGENKIKFRNLLNQFGIPEDDFKDDELEKFLYSNRQQD